MKKDCSENKNLTVRVTKPALYHIRFRARIVIKRLRLASFNSLPWRQHFRIILAGLNAPIEFLTG